MGKFKFTFTNILFWIGIIASLLVFENITFFDKPEIAGFMTLGMQDAYFFSLFAIAMVAYLFLIIYESIFNKTKINYFLLVISLIIIVCGSIGIALFDGMEFTSGASPIVIDDWQKLKHIFSLILYGFSIYSTIHYFTIGHPSIRRLRYLFVIIILATYFFVIYSLVTEYGKYETIANADKDTVIGNLQIKSLFLNSNMFATFVLMGVCSAIGLNYFKKNVFSYVTMVGFAIIEVFVCSLTNILITLVTIFIYFLFEIIINFKKKKASSMIKLSIMVSTYVGIILLFVMCQTFEVPGISNFCRFLYRELSRSNYFSFSNRISIWKSAILGIRHSPLNLFFGYGFRNADYVVGGFMNVADHRLSSHNGYLQILLNFGLVGLLALAAFFIYYFYCLIRLYKTQMRFVLIFFTIGVAYLSLAVTESMIAFNANVQGFLIGTMFFLPVINRYYHLRKTETGDSVIEEHSAPRLLEPALMVRGFGRFIISLMCAISTLFFFEELTSNYIVLYSLINSEVILAILFLTIPYLNGLWSKSGDPYKYVFNGLIIAILIAGVSFGLSYAYHANEGTVIEGFKWATPIAICFILFGAVIIYSVIMGGSFKLYLNTFASFRTALGSFVGMSLTYASLFLAKEYLIPNSFITYSSVLITSIMMFYSCSFITPFGDLMKITRYVDEYNASLVKIDVIRDRLEALNEN